MTEEKDDRSALEMASDWIELAADVAPYSSREDEFARYMQLASMCLKLHEAERRTPDYSE